MVIRSVIWLALLTAPVAAAEKPVPWDATSRVRPCPRHGAGFVKAPGSETCIRLSGRAAVDFIARDRRERAAPIVAPTGRIAIDTRTETEYGPVRTFVRVGGRR